MNKEFEFEDKKYKIVNHKAVEIKLSEDDLKGRINNLELIVSNLQREIDILIEIVKTGAKQDE